MLTIEGGEGKLSVVIRTQIRVIIALMLRDIQARFFGHGLGYLIAIAWPLLHLVIIIAVQAYVGRAVPYGDSAVLFFSTGVLPYIIFSYTSRFTMLGLIHNRTLVSFPVVKFMDIIIARAVLEILASVCTILAFVLGLSWLGIEVWPRDFLEAIYAIAATMLLGFGYGVLNGVIALVLRFWFTGYNLLLIVFYITSGVYFVPDNLPSMLRDLLWYNPLLQCIEWLRSAYYDGYGFLILNKEYAIGCGVAATFSGLLLERAIRGRILQG